MLLLGRIWSMSWAFESSHSLPMVGLITGQHLRCLHSLHPQGCCKSGQCPLIIRNVLENVNSMRDINVNSIRDINVNSMRDIFVLISPVLC